MLMLPPLVPAPPNTEFGPLITSTASRLNRSLRLVWALSRSPSTCMLALALKPRMLMLSPEPPPPSPALKVMPETLDSTWRRLRAFCSWITFCGTTVTVCGVSSSGTAYLAEAERSTLDEACSPVTVSAPSSRGSSLRAASSARAGEEQAAINSISGASGRLVGKGDGSLRRSMKYSILVIENHWHLIDGGFFHKPDSSEKAPGKI